MRGSLLSDRVRGHLNENDQDTCGHRNHYCARGGRSTLRRWRCRRRYNTRASSLVNNSERGWGKPRLGLRHLQGARQWCTLWENGSHQLANTNVYNITYIVSLNLPCKLASSSLYAPDSLVGSGGDAGEILRVLVALRNEANARYEKNVSLHAKRTPAERRRPKRLQYLRESRGP